MSSFKSTDWSLLRHQKVTVTISATKAIQNASRAYSILLQKDELDLLTEYSMDDVPVLSDQDTETDIKIKIYQHLEALARKGALGYGGMIFSKQIISKAHKRKRYNLSDITTEAVLRLIREVEANDIKISMIRIQELGVKSQLENMYDYKIETAGNEKSDIWAKLLAENFITKSEDVKLKEREKHGLSARIYFLANLLNMYRSPSLMSFIWFVLMDGLDSWSQIVLHQNVPTSLWVSFTFFLVMMLQFDDEFYVKFARAVETERVIYERNIDALLRVISSECSTATVFFYLPICRILGVTILESLNISQSKYMGLIEKIVSVGLMTAFSIFHCTIESEEEIEKIEARIEKRKRLLGPYYNRFKFFN